MYYYIYLAGIQCKMSDLSTPQNAVLTSENADVHNEDWTQHEDIMLCDGSVTYSCIHAHELHNTSTAQTSYCQLDTAWSPVLDCEGSYLKYLSFQAFHRKRKSGFHNHLM